MLASWWNRCSMPTGWGEGYPLPTTGGGSGAARGSTAGCNAAGGSAVGGIAVGVIAIGIVVSGTGAGVMEAPRGTAVGAIGACICNPADCGCCGGTAEGGIITGMATAGT
mmetsp:Transcript_64452/g.167508  ORF Transcript_64452/g.167508 Transcript_64452/m.167508 type:complete len:110 (-) Transcript_64452:836-1165(-)